MKKSMSPAYYKRRAAISVDGSVVFYREIDLAPRSYRQHPCLRHRHSNLLSSIYLSPSGIRRLSNNFYVKYLIKINQNQEQVYVS